MMSWIRSSSSILRTCAKLAFGRGIRTSYGQFGEDAFLQAFLREPRGIYVDVGAYDPVLYSNTYAFYRRGWHGLTVDPNPALAPLFAFFRPRDTFVLSGVGEREESLAYHRFSDGAYNTFDAAEALARREKKHLTYLGTSSVPVRPLTEIVREARLTHIDFMNIDVEGMNEAALASHDWSLPPSVIAVEDIYFDSLHPQQSRSAAFLFKKGYELKAHIGHTLVFAKVV